MLTYDSQYLCWFRHQYSLHHKGPEAADARWKLDTNSLGGREPSRKFLRCLCFPLAFVPQ